MLPGAGVRPPHPSGVNPCPRRARRWSGTTRPGREHSAPRVTRQSRLPIEDQRALRQTKGVVRAARGFEPPPPDPQSAITHPRRSSWSLRVPSAPGQQPCHRVRVGHPFPARHVAHGRNVVAISGHRRQTGSLATRRLQVVFKPEHQIGNLVLSSGHRTGAGNLSWIVGQGRALAVGCWLTSVWDAAAAGGLVGPGSPRPAGGHQPIHRHPWQTFAGGETGGAPLCPARAGAS